MGHRFRLRPDSSLQTSLSLSSSKCRAGLLRLWYLLHCFLCLSLKWASSSQTQMATKPSQEIRSASHGQLNVTLSLKSKSNSFSCLAACKEGVFCASKTFTLSQCWSLKASVASFCGGTVYQLMALGTRWLFKIRKVWLDQVILQSFLHYFCEILNRNWALTNHWWVVIKSESLREKVW
jgi:hypothetical protein